MKILEVGQEIEITNSGLVRHSWIGRKGKILQFLHGDEKRAHYKVALFSQHGEEDIVTMLRSDELKPIGEIVSQKESS